MPEERAPDLEFETVHARLEAATRNDPQLRFRILVAAHMLLIVDRQIGRGQGAQEAQWERLAELVGDDASDGDLVSSLRTAVDQCETSLANKRAEGPQGEAEEAELRQSLQAFIRAAVLEKLQLGGLPVEL